MLPLRAEDKPQIGESLDRRVHEHTSPENQNENLMLEIIAHSVLRKMIEDIHLTANSSYKVGQYRIQSLRSSWDYTVYLVLMHRA